MEKEQRLLLLTKFWMDYVGQDHHKDKDCHFYIHKTFSYGREPTYRVEHYGYITEYQSSKEHKTYEKALDELIAFLEDEIKEVYESAKENYDDSDYNWVGVKQVCDKYKLY